MNNTNFVENNFWSKVKKNAGNIPFIKDAIAMYYSMIDPLTPIAAKITIAGALAYFIMPFDAIPDILGPLGFTDDAAVIASALAIVNQYVLDIHYNQADAFLNNSNYSIG